MNLLRISTAGSVDDGKSTLIGRLLYDNNALTKEQEQHIHLKTKEKGLKDLDFSVITDGLIAEREQGITIDVAHIYFSSKTRKFIIADSPGHVEYTRNMVTGASNSEVSVILVDARKGLLEQSYRHFFISKLLRLHKIIFCVNKMDLVDYDVSTFRMISSDIQKMTALYDVDPKNIKIIPISSLKGDNVVHNSRAMSWYEGQTLNALLHDITPEQAQTHVFRLNIQQVLHVQNEDFTDYRAYAGRISSGVISVGDTVRALPSNKTAKVTEIRRYTRVLKRASEGESIGISLDDDIDISRGTLLVKDGEAIEAVRSIKSDIVWLDEVEAVQGDKYILQVGSRYCRVKLQRIDYLIPPENPREKRQVDTLKLNDIAKVDLRLSEAVYLDRYSDNKANGAFILINPNTNNTSAVGLAH